MAESSPAGADAGKPAAPKFVVPTTAQGFNFGDVPEALHDEAAITGIVQEVIAAEQTLVVVGEGGSEPIRVQVSNFAEHCGVAVKNNVVLERTSDSPGASYKIVRRQFPIDDE